MVCPRTTYARESPRFATATSRPRIAAATTVVAAWGSRSAVDASSTAAFACCTAPARAVRTPSRSEDGANEPASDSIAAVLATSPPASPPTPSATARRVTPA
jgi:hypothetical protein